MPHARTLLLIDDDAITREVLEVLLTDAGWVVATAADGAAALDSLRAGAVPTVVLCDLQMPGLSGSSLAEKMRLAAPAVVLIAMTATPRTNTLEMASSEAAPPEGFDALLVKPFNPAAVEEQYNAVVQRTVVKLTDRFEEAADWDATVFAQLRAAMTPERLRALLASVAYDADSRVSRMGAAARAGDDVAYRAEAHALKGSCGMVGAARLWALAADAEKEGLSHGALMEWNPTADFIAATAAIRHMLETLSQDDVEPPATTRG